MRFLSGKKKTFVRICWFRMSFFVHPLPCWADPILALLPDEVSGITAKVATWMCVASNYLPN